MIDLYSSATPNGRKITIMLEELGIKYNPILISLDKKEQFSPEFSKISPTNKIPVIVDKENNQVIFESGAILLYLAKKYSKFLNEKDYWDVVQWLFFQMAYVGPMLGQAHQYLFYHKGKSEFAERDQEHTLIMFTKF
jgi:GST-like protein